MEKKEKHIVVSLVSITLSLFLLLLLVFHIYSYYFTLKRDFNTNLVDLFKNIVVEDLILRHQELSEPFTFGTTYITKTGSTIITTDQGLGTIPKDSSNNKIDQKNLNFLQTILYIENPINIKVLDSLFQKELTANHLSIDFTLLYEDKKSKSSHWSKISDDIDSYLPLLSHPMLLGLQKEMSLQAYFKISPKIIFSHIPFTYWTAILGWILLILILIAFIPYLQKHAKVEVIKNYVSQVLEISELQTEKRKQKWYEKNPNIIDADTSNAEEDNTIVENINEYITLISEDTISVTDYLLFDRKNRKLFNQSRIVPLDSLSTAILYSLLEAPRYFLTNEELRLKVWGSDNTTSETLRQGISRLKKCLKEIPELVVVNIPRVGYQLEIKILTHKPMT